MSSSDSDGPPQPRATLALLALIGAIYAGEVFYPAGLSQGFGDPSLDTLIAWGGMNGTLVLVKGEWFRIFTAALLHGGIVHLLMNALALYSAGRILEPFIGAPWFLGLFVVGAIGGGIASVNLNQPNIVAVGASGAIMALFGFFLTISFRFPKGEVRKAFVVNSLGALLPSLLPALYPLITGDAGLPIDYAAHGGGAVAGAGLGLVFLTAWPEQDWRPPWQGLAVMLTGAALLAVLYGAVQLRTGFAERAFVGRLIPVEQLRNLDRGTDASLPDRLIAGYPDDPRGYFAKARALIFAKKLTEAESFAQAALDRVERYPAVFTQSYRFAVRLTLVGLLIDLKKFDLAKATAAPVCTETEPANMINRLKAAKICPDQ